MKIKPGMTLQEVTDSMTIPPYDIKERDSGGNYTYLWVYRPYNIKRVPIVTPKNKGVDARGRFTGLLVSFNATNTVTNIESCYDCIDPKSNKQKLGKEIITQIVATLLAVTAPALLVYFSLEPQQ